MCASLDMCTLYNDILISEQPFLNDVPSRPCINSELKSGPRAKCCDIISVCPCSDTYPVSDESFKGFLYFPAERFEEKRGGSLGNTSYVALISGEQGKPASSEAPLGKTQVPLPDRFLEILKIK